jgi:acyl carrier protein
MSNTKNRKTVKKIAALLKTTEEKLLKLDNFQKFENWDSLIHLEILSILEKNYGKKLNKIKNLSELMSLKKILSKIN